MKRFFLISFICMILCSCVVTQSIKYKNVSPLSGSSSSLIEVSDFFINVVQDLSSWHESNSNDPISDVALNEFAENINNSLFVHSIDICKNSENSYYIYFSFSDFEKLIEDLCSNTPSQDLLTIKREQDNTIVFNLKINLENWETLTQLLPFLAQRNFAVWGPVYNNPPYGNVSEEDYKELVGFILGEEGPKAIEDSLITLVLTVPSKIRNTNGEILSDDTVSFSFPLIDFLLLHDEILFWCKF